MAFATILQETLVALNVSAELLSQNLHGGNISIVIESKPKFTIDAALLPTRR